MNTIECKYFDAQVNTPRKALLHYHFTEDNGLNLILHLDQNKYVLNHKETLIQKHGDIIHIMGNSLPKNAYVSISEKKHQTFLLKNFSNKSSDRQSIPRWIFGYLAICGSILVISILGWLHIERLAQHFPEFMERWLENQALLVLRLDKNIIATPDNNHTLNKIYSKLVKLDPDFKNLKLEVSNSEEINAVTIPNNHIIVFKGLIDNAESIEEILGVICHELGHAKKKHNVRTHIKMIGLDILQNIILGGDAINIGLLIFPSQSQKDEQQADELAAFYLDKMGVSTSGMVRFFEFALEKNKDKKFKLSKFFATHPPSADRKFFFESRQKKYKKSIFTSQDLVLLKKSLQQKTS